MQFMKKILCALILCVMAFPCTAFADSSIETAASETISLFDTVDSSVSLTDEECEFMEFFASQLKERETEISVPETFNITSERFGQIYSECMGSFLTNEHPEIFYFDGSVSYNKGILKKITPKYSMTDEEIDAVGNAITAELNKIKNLLDDSMSDMEKVLVVHDYIAASYEYDTTLFTNPGKESRRLDSMVLKKKGVCQGYASLFKYVMDNIGIECENVLSDECSHVWNKVKISADDESEEKWYNIDVTADDPLMDMASNISHSQFLVNDNEIKTLNPELHSAWNTYKWDNKTPATVSDSTDFSSSVIHDIGGQIVYKDGIWYGFLSSDNSNHNALSVIDIKNNDVIPRYTTSSDFKWFVSGSKSSYYPSQISSMVLLDGNIYFNSPNQIYMYNPKTNSADVIYDFETKNPDYNDISKTYIFGIRVRNNRMHIEYTTQPFTTADSEGNITEAKMDAIIPVEITSSSPFPCLSEITPLEGHSIRISLSIPDPIKSSAAARIAQYNENGLFIGFADPIEDETDNYICADNCKTVKAFIWDNFYQKPLADVSAFVFE